ncbi:MAG: 30S ribosomal protein S6 [Saprospiraceae bacterium]
MRHYEVTFIVDPVLSGDEVKSTAEHIFNELKNFGAAITAIDEMGLRSLAYPINKRHSGIYFCVEFSTQDPAWIAKFELNMKRNERILRFLTVKLDQFGVKYNDDKRNGRIGKRKEAIAAAEAADAKAPAPEVVDFAIDDSKPTAINLASDDN